MLTRFASLHRKLFPALIFCLLLGNGIRAQQNTSGNMAVEKEQYTVQDFIQGLLNKPVKDFNLTDIQGEKINARDLKGKIVVMNFWFTACKPCILEMPHLNSLVAANRQQPVVFLAPAPENEMQIKKFLKKYSFDYRIIPSSWELITDWKIENFPTHLVIDREGIIRQGFIGYAPDIAEKLQAEIDKLK